MDKLTHAREKRGLTISDLARETGIGFQTIRNLEGGTGATRPGDPEKASMPTALALIERLWPDLQLHDFDSNTTLVANPRNKKAARVLSKNAAA